jgi:hypothetical protein
LQTDPEPEARDRADGQGFSMTDNVILEALEMMTFTSIRQIAKIIMLIPTTAFRRFTKSLRFASIRFASP